MRQVISESDRPRPEETEIVATWVVVQGRVEGDAATLRIDRLIADYFVRLGRADGGWSTLYRDPTDGRFWEHSYPQSEMHGGGPPRLQVMPPAAAAAKYGVSAG